MDPKARFMAFDRRRSTLLVGTTALLAGAAYFVPRWSGPPPTRPLTDSEWQQVMTETWRAVTKGGAFTPPQGLPNDLTTTFLVAGDGTHQGSTVRATADGVGASLAKALSVLPHQASPVRWLKVELAAGAVSDAGTTPLPIIGRFIDAQGIRPTYRGHRVVTVVTVQNLDASLEAAGQYLRRAERPDGSFVYQYHARDGREDPSYNILRHAGTTFALFQLAKAFNEPSFGDAAKRSADYLMSQITACPAADAADLCVVEGDSVKLGGNALALIAFAEESAYTGSLARLPTMRALARRLLHRQAASGEFTGHKQNRTTGAYSTNFQSSYYPGESLWALLKLNSVDPNPEWLDSAVIGARFLIRERDGKTPNDELEHDHWFLYALNDLFRLKPDPELMTYVKRLVGAIIDAQNLGDDWPEDWLGSWMSPPRSTPAATRVEGLLAAARMLRDNGEPVLAERATLAAKTAAKFLLATQLTPESAMTMKDPERALGGFRSGLEDDEIRIDYVQHNVSALLALREVLK